MKKSILTLGRALNKAEQQSINGGSRGCGSNYGTNCAAYWALPPEIQECVDVNACCECHPDNPDYSPYTEQFCIDTNGFC